MFPSSTGAFKKIICPSVKTGSDCDILNCIFGHQELKPKNHQSKKSEISPKRPSLQDASDELEIIGAPPKRRKGCLDRVNSGESGGQSAREPTVEKSKPSLKSNSVAAKKVLSNSRENNVVDTRIRDSTTVDATLLTPRKVEPFSPALIPQRVAMLKVIHKALLDCGSHILPKTQAMDLELEVASKSSKVSYPMNIRTLVKNIKQGKYQNVEEKKEKENQAVKDRYQKELEKLIIPLDVLQANLYVTSIVKPKELNMSSYLPCARCGTDFEIGRRTPTTCTYHLLRREYDLIKKKRSDVFPCCAQMVGESSGCCSTNRHVFKLDDPQQLASVVPFSKVPHCANRLFAAGIDCEMGFTSYGMELIRVTVVDWDSGNVVLDRVVRPYGEIIDFNTRFSGISSLDNGIQGSDGKIYSTITFKQVRDLLFEHISADTILVGHGLQNDLNALRLIHHRVVDTAIRYPIFKPPRTYSLKQLAFQYLGKTIQLGEHDSSEDAIVAMEIVKENIKRSLNRVEVGFT